MTSPECPAPPKSGGIASATLADIIEWDVRSWGSALEWWSTHTRQSLPGRLGLELGSRHGGLSLWLALHGARVICSDLEGPTEQAIFKHQAAGVSHLIEYGAVDATNIPFTNHFDIILFKSVLGGIGVEGGRDGQAAALREIHRALKPGGELFFAENLASTPLHMLLRRKYSRAHGGPWRYVSIEELEDLLAPFSSASLRTNGFAACFGRTETQRNLLGRMDTLLFDRIVPPRWRYVVTGVARK